MGLQYVKEHFGCSEYATTENRLFHVIEIKVGEYTERRFADKTLLGFMVSGNIKMNCDKYKDRYIKKGEMFVIPKFSDIKIFAEDNVVMLVCVFSAEMEMCNKFSLNNLKKSVSSAFIYDFNTLVMCSQLRDCIKLLVTCLSDGLGCKHFHRMKRDEIFLYLRAYYSKQDLAKLFYPIIGTDIDFKDFIMSRYTETCDPRKLAEMANMSIVTFNRRFKAEFNMSTSKWLKQKKADMIRMDIEKTDIPFNEIAEKYNLSSAAYLVYFCKQHFGMTPHEIRECVSQ